MLFELARINIVGQFNQPVKIPLFDPLGFREYTPSFKQLDFAECEYGFRNIFGFLPFEDFLFLYLSILLEKTIIVVSLKPFINTGLLTLLRCSMSPFDWQFPSIYNISEECISMLSSPVPILVGIRATGKEFVDLLEKNQIKTTNSVTVLISESLIIHDQDMSKYVLPQKNDFYKVLKSFYYKHFNKHQSQQFRIH